MNKKNITFILIVLVIAGLYYFLFYKNNTRSLIYNSPQNKEEQQVSTTTPLEPLNIPNDWKTYSNSEWGIAFAYPKEWSIEEIKLTEYEKARSFSKDPVGIITKVILNSADYEVQISRKNPADFTEYPYVKSELLIDDHKANSYLRDEVKGYLQFISLDDGSKNSPYLFQIGSKTNYKKVISDFLNTIRLVNR